MSEIIIRDGSLALHAKMAMDVRKQIADLQSQETVAKDIIASESMSMAETERDKGNYVSIIRITPEDSAPIRTELRITNGALIYSEKEKLEKLFGADTDELFNVETQIGAITDPQSLIDAVKAKGIDPWKVFNLSVKDGNLAIAIDAGAPYNQFIVPKKGFLNTLCELGNRLCDHAKIYINTYLKNTLKPVVVLGTKGKGE